MKKIFIVFLAILLLAFSTQGCSLSMEAKNQTELSTTEELKTFSPKLSILKEKVKPLIETHENQKVTTILVTIGFGPTKVPYMILTAKTNSGKHNFYLQTAYIESLSISILESKDTIIVDNNFLIYHFPDTYSISENVPEQLEIPLEDFLENAEYNLSVDRIIIK